MGWGARTAWTGEHAELDWTSACTAWAGEHAQPDQEHTQLGLKSMQSLTGPQHTQLHTSGVDPEAVGKSLGLRKNSPSNLQSFKPRSGNG
jgi:hypothetical protein